MKIGGLQKQSFIDYPGRIGCVVFLSGCNFACPYCHNPRLTGDPAAGPDAFSVETLIEFLDRRRGFLEGVVISGGEPTLHAELPELCRRIKGLGYAVKLDTNGSRPRVLELLLAGRLVDYVAMDVKTDPERYAGGLGAACAPDAIHASVRLLMNAGLDYEFRTTCVKPLVTPATIARIARLIEGGRLYALQPFKTGSVLRPDYFADADPAFSAAEMEQLRRIAAPCVEACTLR